jgi:hypothetical protein
MTNLHGKMTAPGSGGLRMQLAELRGRVDGLAARFNEEYGGSNEAAQRAEQLAAAIQRLEWALGRQQSRKASEATSR